MSLITLTADFQQMLIWSYHLKNDLGKKNPKCFVCRCQCVCQRRGDREAEEREVIIVGGMMFTSGPAWANRYIVCFVYVCVHERAHVSKYSRLVRLSSTLTCIPFLSPSTVFFWLHLFPKPISPSLCHCLMVSSLLLILPLSALNIANQTANTEAHAHTHMAKGKCCEEQQVVLLSLSLVPVTLFIPSLYSVT